MSGASGGGAVYSGWITCRTSNQAGLDKGGVNSGDFLKPRNLVFVVRRGRFGSIKRNVCFVPAIF